jgi:acetyl esterase/lipase
MLAMKHHWMLALTAIALLILSSPGWVGGKQDPPGVPLWADGAPGAKGTTEKDSPAVIVHLPAADKANGCAVVICPGGGYGGLAMSYEGHDVASWLNTLGVAGLVLRYRHAPAYAHPIPLADASRALRLTRARAKEWNIDPQRVGILGFSAGGHLASTAATHFSGTNKDAKDPIDALSSRPDFAILVYPVITMTSPYTHQGSRKNLLGAEPEPQLIEELSNEKQVTKETPPTFLVHTSEDKVVPPENSVLFYLALRKHNVPAEMHLYEKGNHGLGLGVGRTTLSFQSWPERGAAWLQGRGLLNKR